MENVHLFTWESQVNYLFGVYVGESQEIFSRLKTEIIQEKVKRIFINNQEKNVTICNLLLEIFQRNQKLWNENIMKIQ
jgi:hypothetical protein